uniref:(California timema) hypothetical protein n=1 Tax=Timema californicum TaxID=61474 RepID=A0A7R9P3T2_TIMCA|nr:unnamed protein product [Timema californicum]
MLAGSTFSLQQMGTLSRSRERKVNCNYRVFSVILGHMLAGSTFSLQQMGTLSRSRERKVNCNYRVSSVILGRMLAGSTFSLQQMGTSFGERKVRLEFVWDTPNQHPRITKKERDYINSSIAGVGGGQKRKFPAKQAFTSFRFWVLIISHTGSLAGLIFLQSLAPKYMNDVLGYNIRESGGLSSLPYLARLLLGLVFSLVADWLLAKEKMTTWGIRRWFTIPSHLIPGLLLVSIGFTGCNPAFSVALMTIGLGMNGASVVTNLINQHDLAPNFAGICIITIDELSQWI